MEIKVRTIMTLAQHLGGPEIPLQVKEGASVSDALRELRVYGGEQFCREVFDPKTDKPYKHLFILVNSRIIRPLDGLTTVLKEGDVLMILPLVPGG